MHVKRYLAYVYPAESVVLLVVFVVVLFDLFVCLLLLFWRGCLVVVFWEGLFVVVLLFLFSFWGDEGLLWGCWGGGGGVLLFLLLALAHFHVAIVGACGVDQNLHLMTVSSKTDQNQNKTNTGSAYKK